MITRIHKNRLLISIVCTIIMIAATILIHKLEIDHVSADPFYSLVHSLTNEYQIRQILMIYALFLYGFLLVVFLAPNMSFWHTLFLAFPTSIAVYTVCVHIMMMVGVKYNVLNVILLLSLVLLLDFFLNRSHMHEIRNKVKCFPPYAILLIGLSAISTTGVFLIYMSNDSYHYIAEFGWMIGKIGYYDKSCMVDLLTSTGISPAIIASMGVLFGFEAIYGIHVILISSMLGFFIMSFIKMAGSLKKSIIPFACLFTCSAFLIICGWVISTTYWMVYNTILIIILYEMIYNKTKEFPIHLLILFSVMITITRQEGILFLCVICIWLVSYSISRKEIYLILVPGILVELLLFVRVFLIWQIRDTYLMTPEYAVIFSLLMTGIVIYIGFVSGRYKQYNEMIIYIGFLLLTVAIAIIKKEQFIINVKATLKNLSSNHWGVVPWLVIIMLIELFSHKWSHNFIMNVWICQLIFAFLMNGIRIEPLRYSVYDSFSRIIMALMPLIMYAVTDELKDSFIFSKFDMQSQ